MTPEEKEKDVRFKLAVISFAEVLVSALAWAVPLDVRTELREWIQTMWEALK